MAIKRYISDADTTITNAFNSNLTTRGTGSNMGASDVLEVFSIYGQQASSSAELSRILVKFPTADISTDRTNGDIPASGSVSFYLRMYNCKHAFTLPRNMKLVATPLNTDWEEGLGLDMESYSDKTRDSIEGANWMNSGQPASATATITAQSVGSGLNTRKLLITDAEGNSVNFNIDNSLSTSTATSIALGNANSNATQLATNIAAAVNAADTADTLNISATSSGAVVTLTMTTKSTAANLVADISGTGVDDGAAAITKQFSGAFGAWVVPGAAARNQQDTYSLHETDTFHTGSEDLEVDVSRQVEDWLAGTYSNNGFVLSVTSSQEAYVQRSADDSVTYVNTTGSQTSYYTKKFFSRTSEFFFKRPCIEARWNSSKQDDRGNCYFSSSLASQANNLNTIYLYNYVRGQLQNIPDDSTGLVFVNIFSGNLANTLPGTSSIVLPQGGGVPTAGNLCITGGYVSTGIYSASFAITGSRSSLTTIYDVWSNTGDRTVSAYTQYHSGSIEIKDVVGSNINPNSTYATKVTNLKAEYDRAENARFRLFVREKSWKPNIYSKASTQIQNTVVDSAYYKIYRTIDKYDVIPYGTGSTNHTKVSYDVSGSYFDLDMNLLEKGYSYGIKIVYYLNGKYVEQPDTFKFRVDEHER